MCAFGPSLPVKVGWQQDVFVLGGGDGAPWLAPRFTFHGFRYVEVTGLTAPPAIDDIQGIRLSSDVDPAGTFESSNPLWNRIHEITRWTFLSNLFSVQSDCPHRERLGYGGDIVATAEAAMLQFDMGRFYAKAVRDLADAARPGGGFTETAPFVGISDHGLAGGVGPMGWTAAHPVLLRELLRYYGDRALLDEQYEALVRHCEFVLAEIGADVSDRDISDHGALGPRPRGLTATAFWLQTLRTAAEIAGIARPPR
jgi:alpha-L-rhamnosidase